METILIIAIVVLVLQEVKNIFNKFRNSPFKKGFEFAEGIFNANNFKKSVIVLERRIQGSSDYNTYDKFDEGIKQCMKERLSCQCDNLNDYEGGDWYYCKEQNKFKDSLTSREFVL